MQANELRIGNWVTLAGKNIRCDVKDIAGCKRMPVLRHPIPLTPEILEKCGFVRGTETLGFKNWYINYCGFVLSNAPDDMESPKDFYLKQDIDKPHYICYVKCLHQLQNLYYALTGTELTITL